MTNSVGIIGNYNIDIVIGNVKEPPRWDTEIMADRFERRVAGTAGYMVLALHGLGIPSVILSTIGKDESGQFLLQALQQKGLEVEGVVQLPDQQTPTSYVIVHKDGSRAIISVSGAHDHFGLRVYHAKKYLLESCREIVICGTYLLPEFSVREAVEVAKEQRELGKKIYFDPSWDPNGWKEETREQTYHLLQHVDVFMPNETEICHLTGKADWQSAVSVVSRYCGEIVVKLGAEGAAVLKDGQLTRMHWDNKVEVMDTTGAGDMFDMGYLLASRRGESMEYRLRFANELASAVISQKDRENYPSLEQIESKL